MIETAFQKARLDCNLRKVFDGAEAIAYLEGWIQQNPLPAAFLLDLSMPKKEWLDVLNLSTQSPNCATLRSLS